MEIKILQVFYGKDGLPYKDKDRQVHFPIACTGFLGASNTTKIKFYYDELDETNQTTWVAVSKLPNGKLGSKVLESYFDDELNEHYALLELGEYYTQYKGDVFISLQGYQGGVNLDFDEETQQYEIHGTPTIAATGSIKFTINYAPQFVGSGQTENINFQRILADLGTKLGIRAYSEYVEELPSEGNPNIFYVVNDDPNNPNLANIYIWNSETRHYIWVGDNTLDLGEYYTKEEGEQFESDIDDRVTSVESELSSVAQGSPKGVYSTLAALQAAYPTGTTGIYVVSADGHWYYWNGSAWTDGGTYQATQIADGSVTRAKLADALKSKMLLQYTSTDYKDLNTAPKNSVLCYSSLTNYIDQYSNYPVAENGTLLSLNGWDGASASSNLGDVQVYITYTGRIYSRSVGANNVFTPWKELLGTERTLYIYLADLSFRDFNTVPKNSCICFVNMNASAYSHYPTLENGTLFTYNAYASPTYPDAVTVQMYFTQDSSKVFVRSCQVNTWTNWVELAKNDNSFFKAYFSQNSTYKDFNTVPNNSVICYSNSDWTGYSNYPVATYGTLITFNGYQASSNIAKTQIYITSANDVYTRISWGGGAVFSAWNKLAREDASLYIHKYKSYVKRPYNFNGKSAVFFGDSITYGWLSGNNRVEHPYPELFSSKVGLTGYNEAISASAFSPNSQSQTNIIINQAINSTHKSVDFVFCAAGTNDCGFGVSLSDLKTNVNNFIDYVLENYPNAQLIFITPIARLDGYESLLQPYRNIITECAITKDDGRISVVQGNDFDFPIASDNSDFRSTLFADSVHPSQKGYSTAYLYGLLKELGM